MRLLLVHHADALGPDVDPQRPLSSHGLEQARRLVERFANERIRLDGTKPWVPAAVWHSGKLRARQTAEAFLKLNPFAQFKMMRGLRPDDPPDFILRTLVEDPTDVVLVGHMPFLPALRYRLTSVDAPFPLHGLVLAERDDDRWIERIVLTP
jgi:phosphohistidine phosphatase